MSYMTISHDYFQLLHFVFLFFIFIIPYCVPLWLTYTTSTPLVNSFVIRLFPQVILYDHDSCEILKMQCDILEKHIFPLFLLMLNEKIHFTNDCLLNMKL